jgi:hypothetical protein
MPNVTICVIKNLLAILAESFKGAALWKKKG